MSQTVITKCDACGKTKGVDNHWFAFYQVADRSKGGVCNRFEFKYIIEDIGCERDRWKYYDICSTECIRIKLNELLQIKPKCPVNDASKEDCKSCKENEQFTNPLQAVRTFRRSELPCEEVNSELEK